MPRSFWLETLGCPKNQVDSDKLVGTPAGRRPRRRADGPDGADLVVVNTCAFIEEARQESIDTVLALADDRADGARVVVTGCLAERYGDELAEALPEVDLVAGFGVAGARRHRRRPARSRRPGEVPSFDLLNLPRPPRPRRGPTSRWPRAATGRAGSAPSRRFRGQQRSRSIADILAEVDALEAREIVLVAQDLASYGRDQGRGRARPSSRSSRRWPTGSTGSACSTSTRRELTDG